MTTNHLLPYSTSYIAYSRIKYDHGYQSPENPFEWDGYGSEIYTSGLKIINAIDEIANRPFDDNIFLKLNCPYCSGQLQYYKEYQRDGLEWAKGDALKCLYCNWWLYCFTKNKFYPFESFRNEFYESIVYVFDTKIVDTPITALREEIRKRKTDLRSISPKELEVLVGSVFRDYLDCRVHHIGGPSDGGIDLLISESKTPCAIQVKRRANAKSKEGVRVVRDLLGSIVLAEVPKGIVVSTADDFSAKAKEAASSISLNRMGIQMELHNYKKVMELINITAPPEKPWLHLLPNDIR
jgi:hypothetical protein